MAFLTQRGLLHSKAKWGDFFYAGFLNKMYLRMNDIVFHGTARVSRIVVSVCMLLTAEYPCLFDRLCYSLISIEKADILHLGATGTRELDMEDIDAQTQARPSSMGTGNGTDENDSSIRPRPLYRWEGMLEDPLRNTRQHHQPLLAKLGVWFGLTPRWRSGVPSMGLALDVRLDNGQYVLLEEDATIEDLEGKS